MDGMYSWKRTKETEIDLIDLLYCLCRRWKRIAVCALAFALALGWYGWAEGRNSLEGTDAVQTVTAAEAELTEEEEQAVADAVWLEKESRELETYLERSVLMQIDPYHKSRYIMLFRIDRAERRELPAVTESYLNFVLNGGAADALAEAGKWQYMDKSCLAELISAYQRTYTSPYQVVLNESIDGSVFSESLFYVEVTGKNAKEAEKMALAVQDVIKKYSEKIRKAAGSHRLVLVSSEESMMADSGLLQQQREKRNLLSSNKANLKAVIDAFSEEQLAVYEEAVCAEKDQKESEKDEFSGGKSDKNRSNNEESQIAASGSFLFRIKYIIFGLIGGIIAYCSIFAFGYVFRDTIKSTDELKRMYTFPIFGGIALPGTNRKKGSSFTDACRDAYGQTEAQVLNRIRLACKRQEITKLCAVCDFALFAAEQECLESMAAQLKGCGINMSVAECASENTAVWDSLTETGNVLMVCRTGMTTHRMIDNAVNFYLENGAAVMGTVVFLQNV